MADNEYIKRSMVVEIIEEEIRRQNSVSEVLTCAHLRTAVMGLPTADVAPRADVAREIFEDVEKTLVFGVDRFRVLQPKKKYTEADHDPLGYRSKGKDMADKTTPKHPSYNCQRGMLCPTCDYALWTRVEIRGIFGTKKITVKEQPNFCKNCGQALLYAYTEA